MCEAKPGQTPAGGAGALSVASVTVVPAAGVPALTAYCVPPCVPLAEHAEPVHVVAAIGVAPQGRTSIEIDGRRRDRRRAAA